MSMILTAGRRPGLAALLLGLLAGVLACGGSDSEAQRPNILFVVIDTLRADRVGCYGAPMRWSHAPG